MESREERHRDELEERLERRPPTEGDEVEAVKDVMDAFNASGTIGEERRGKGTGRMATPHPEEGSTP